MINVLLPLGGMSTFFESSEYAYPIPLIEIYGIPMVELAIKNCQSLGTSLQFIFVVKNDDCQRYHLDETLKLLTDNQCHVVKLSNETKGAACSALLAISYINNDTPLIILNSDQLIDEDFSSVIRFFRNENASAGMICFESVHPRWSYVRLNDQGDVMETAEKRPISKHAIAGFYYFRQGKCFIEAAMQSIKKNRSFNGMYYIAPVFNELVLESQKIVMYKIENSKYHTFYSPQKIQEYEQGMKEGARVQKL